MPTHPSSRRPRRVRRALASMAIAGLAVGTVAVGAAVPANAIDRLFGHGVGSSDATAIVGAPAAPARGSTTDPDRSGYGSWQPESPYDPWASSPFADLSPFGSGPQPGATTTNTSDATSEQSVGLAMIRTDIDYGAGEAAGTGMVLTDDGYVVTNHHVVAGATQIEVTIPATGQTYEATYVGGNAERDVAVIHLEGASDLTPVDVDASGVSVGDEVVSVGDAGGDGGTFTAAPGTISRTDTDITVSNEDGTRSRLTDLVEVTSDIVPGDSGGALLDQDGDVVGMNVAATSGGGDINGYVIPIGRVVTIADQILSGDQADGIVLGTSGFLGVTLSSGTTPLVAGVVADSAAEGAGLVAGDTVTAVDGQPVSSATDLQEAIAAHGSGDSVQLQWTDRAGASHSAEVTLGSAPVA